MEARKTEKTTAIIISLIVILLNMGFQPQWNHVAIYKECTLQGRLIYPFFHANILHTILNAWCLLSIVFIYNISIGRLTTAYIIAATIPVDTLAIYFQSMQYPTVGLSAIIYFLFASISFQVARKRYYQACMILYLAIGFLFPKTNAAIHLYAYIAGIIYAILNKPIKIKSIRTIHNE